jgi:hypothetical protein
MWMSVDPVKSQMVKNQQYCDVWDGINFSEATEPSARDHDLYEELKLAKPQTVGRQFAMKIYYFRIQQSVKVH